MFEILKESYTSPRITGEVSDCSMPMTFDQYNNCGFSCAYCFSTFQRSIGASSENYLAKKVKKVDLKKFKWYFTELENPKNPFRNYIKNKITMQFGGLSDPFCPIEEQEGLGYEILSFLKEIKYPVCFSSKSDLLLRDKKYLDLFDDMQDYWSYKASIITYEENKARVLEGDIPYEEMNNTKRIEASVPSPEERLLVLKALSEKAIHTILRLRPFIVGLTDLSYEKLMYKAAEYGVKAVSTEFFCLELRSINVAKAKFDLISKIVGFDIVNFYKNISSTNGYLRLNYSIKEPYIKRMEEICKETGMSLHVSDAHHKEKGNSGSCCGLPSNDKFKFSKCQFTYALWYAKNNGEVRWSDIAKHDLFLKDFTPITAPGFNTGSNIRREKKCHMTMFDYLRNLWNNPKEASSPYKYFQGILIPDRLDENEDLIYRFNHKKAGMEENFEGCKNCKS